MSASEPTWHCTGPLDVVTAYVVMAHILVAEIVTAYVVMDCASFGADLALYLAYIVMAYIVMAYIVMDFASFGADLAPYRATRCGYVLYNCGRYAYGLYSYGRLGIVPGHSMWLWPVYVSPV